MPPREDQVPKAAVRSRIGERPRSHDPQDLANNVTATQLQVLRSADQDHVESMLDAQEEDFEHADVLGQPLRQAVLSAGPPGIHGEAEGEQEHRPE